MKSATHQQRGRDGCQRLRNWVVIGGYLCMIILCVDVFAGPGSADESGIMTGKTVLETREGGNTPTGPPVSDRELVELTWVPVANGHETGKQRGHKLNRGEVLDTKPTEQTIDLTIRLRITGTGNQFSVVAEMPSRTLDTLISDAAQLNRPVGGYFVSQVLSLDIGLVEGEQVENITRGDLATLQIQYTEFELNSIPELRATVADERVNVLLRDPIVPGQSPLLNTTEYRIRMPGRITESTTDIAVGQTAIWHPTAGAAPAVIQSYPRLAIDTDTNESTTGGQNGTTDIEGIPQSPTSTSPRSTGSNTAGNRTLPSIPIIAGVGLCCGVGILWWIRKRKIAAEREDSSS